MALSSRLLCVITMQFIASSVAVKSCTQCRGTITANFRELGLKDQELEVDVLNTSNPNIKFVVHPNFDVLSGACPVSTTGYVVSILVTMAEIHISATTKASELSKTITDLASALANRPCSNGAILKTGTNGLTIPNLSLKCNAAIDKIPLSVVNGVINVFSDKPVNLDLSIELARFYIESTVTIADDGQTRISEIEYIPSGSEKPDISCTVVPNNATVKTACECVANEIFQNYVIEALIPSFMACYVNSDEFARLRNALNCSP